MSTKEDLQNDDIPKFIYDIENRKLMEWQGQFIYGWGWHHTVKQQILKRNPEMYKHLKMIYFPPINACIKTIDGKIGNPHLEADSKHSKYKERWGIELSDVIYIK